jgi:hypothetical protein
MSLKDMALKQAGLYGMQWEVQTWYDLNIKAGDSDESAWRHALQDWDCWPYGEMLFHEAWVYIANIEYNETYQKRRK